MANVRRSRDPDYCVATITAVRPHRTSLRSKGFILRPSLRGIQRHFLHMLHYHQPHFLYIPTASITKVG
jgi:hypothetical protein